jgi:hypothetical protein
MSVRRAMHRPIWSRGGIGCIAEVATIEKQEETDMRLKLLSPGEMNAEQKETYDESIAGKRGAPPAPMMGSSTTSAIAARPPSTTPRAG